MKLLVESKKIWILSYIICTIIPGILYCLLWDYPNARTIGIMFIEVQVIMFVFFLFILIFNWKVCCRIVASLIYLGVTIYEGVNGNLVKWYIIIPVFLITEVYLLWNLGGIINCVIASPYRDRINEKVNVARSSYDSYANALESYNSRNNLGFFTKVRKKREPNWEKLGFNYSALDMFCFVDALIGINTSKLDKKEEDLNNINSNLEDKNSALYNNWSINEEKDVINRIGVKAKTTGLDSLNYNATSEKLDVVRKMNVIKEKKILRKKL